MQTYPCPKCGTTEELRVTFKVPTSAVIRQHDGELLIDKVCVWDDFPDEPHEVECGYCGTTLTDEAARTAALAVYHDPDVYWPSWQFGS